MRYNQNIPTNLDYLDGLLIIGFTTETYFEDNTISAIKVSSTLIALKDGDRIRIGGQNLQVKIDAAIGSTTIVVYDYILTETIESKTRLDIDRDNLFEQYQRKTEGTIAGMPVGATSLGPISESGGKITGDFDILVGVDLDYIKILPRDFISNDDVGGKALLFQDGTNTGMIVEDPSQEMVCSVQIPYGKTATDVIIYSNNSTKNVDVYEMNINANGLGSAIGTGTLNSTIDITDTISTGTNYLLILVKVSSSNHRIWGGFISLI